MANTVFKELEKGNLPGLKRCLSLFPTSASTKNSAGSTPLHIAAALGLTPFVRELLLHGAPHDVADSQGNLPLHLAAEQGSIESVTELLTGPGRKLGVKAKNKDGQTPLHLAVRNGNTAVAAKLLEAGARSDAKDKSGTTPLELVAPDHEELLQLLLASTPTSSLGSMSLGIGVSAASRSFIENSQAVHRPSPSAGGAPPPTSGNAVSRIASTPPPSNARTSATGTPVSARTPAAASASGTPGGTGSRLPRNSSGASGGIQSQLGGGTGAGVGQAAGLVGTPVAAPAVNAQLQKHEVAIQALQADLRAATERLNTVDAVASAQLECAAQVEKALEASGSHGQLMSELEARVAFQEDRGRDTRSRVERLEEGERAVQDSIARLNTDHRSLNMQLRDMLEQVATLRATRQTAAADVSSAAAQQQLQADVAGLRAQLEVLSPVMVVATTAGAEARALAARLDALQLQVQQGQQQQQQAGSAALEQQVLQLQAQVQLLQLPVASVTQQCTDMASKLSGFTEWQQQARADLERLVQAATAAQSGQASGGSTGSSGGELSEAVMRVLDTTARTMAELRQQQDATAKQVAELLAQQQQQHATAPATPFSPVAPGLPVTPNGANHRRSSAGGDAGFGALGGPPSRGPQSVGGRDAALQAEMRSELEVLKEQLAEVRKEMATEGGSLRREWQRAFSDMQSRYGEQTNELQRREQKIASIREAALAEEADRRAAVNFEDKVAKRLTKLETGIEYLTHRLEVLEEQVTGIAQTLTGANSPGFVLSPTVRAAAAAAASRGQPGASGQPPSGPGPVSENHGQFVATASHLAIAAASVASSPLAHSKAGMSTAAAALSSGAAEPQPRAGSAPSHSASGSAAQLLTAGDLPPGLQAGAPLAPVQTCTAGSTASAGTASLGHGPVALDAVGTHRQQQQQQVDAPLGLSATGLMPPSGAWHGSGDVVLDPASVALGPQLLPAAAQGFLAPSMDIQRVAAMAAARQQQEIAAAQQNASGRQTPSRQRQQNSAVQGPVTSTELRGGTTSTSRVVQSAATPAAHQTHGKAGQRKEPPMCLYCSVQ